MDSLTARPAASSAARLIRSPEESLSMLCDKFVCVLLRFLLAFKEAILLATEIIPNLTLPAWQTPSPHHTNRTPRYPIGSTPGIVDIGEVPTNLSRKDRGNFRTGYQHQAPGKPKPDQLYDLALPRLPRAIHSQAATVRLRLAEPW